MDLFERYQIFIAGVAGQCQAAFTAHGKAMRCRPGCADCCRPFSLLPLEMAVVRQAVRELDHPRLEALKSRVSQESDRCPLLEEGLCVIYASRPLICRTQGFPLGYVDHEQEVVELSVCPLNFQEQQLLEKEALLYMDPLNEQLSRLNAEYGGEHHLPAGIRYEIRDSLRVFLEL